MSIFFTGADANIVDNHERTALVIAFVMLELDIVQRAQYRLANPDSTVVSDNRAYNLVVSETGILRFQEYTIGRQLSTDNTDLEESMFTPLVRLLVLSGAHFPEGWNKDYSKAPLWIRNLYEEIRTAQRENKVQRPAKLVHLCRLAIRAQLANISRLHYIHLVPLPQKLRDYLEVKYL